MRIPTLILALLWTGTALGHDSNVSWLNATTATDGTALPATGPDALRDTTVRWGTCNVDKTAIAVQSGTHTVLIPATTLLVPGLPDGTFCFQGQHSTNAGVLSNWSAVVSKTYVTAKKPRPPNSMGVN